MQRALCLALTAALLVACGSSTPSDTDTEAVATTSGGESAPSSEHALRTTVPVPVPQPAIAREEMSEALQQLWTQVEEAVAIRPPDAPSEATEEAVQAWADGPFSAWVGERRTAMVAIASTSEDVPADPPYERAVAAALMGYALEDFAADVRGAPIPSDIASDVELLQIYVDNLSQVLRPIAVEAVVSYAFCQRQLAPLGDDSNWVPWRAYCVQRGREMIEVYELTPPSREVDPGEATGEEAEPAS